MTPPRPWLRLDIATGGLRRFLPVAMASLALLVAQAGPAAAQTEAPDDRVDIVVTTSILGSVVQDLVNDRASVTVLMANGVDPHDWAPSAQDIEALYAADLVVANGLGLEEGLQDALEQAEAEGTHVFEATDHIDIRELGEATHGHESEAGHASRRRALPGGQPRSRSRGGARAWRRGPPLLGRPGLHDRCRRGAGPVIGELGASTSATARRIWWRDWDPSTQTIRRPALRSFPARLGSWSPATNPWATSLPAMASSWSARSSPACPRRVRSRPGLADLAEQIRDEGVSVIFAEAGTPRPVADSIASETGAGVVELPSHSLPDDGSYFTFISDIAESWRRPSPDGQADAPTSAPWRSAHCYPRPVGTPPGASHAPAGATMGPLIDPFLDNGFMVRALLAGVLVSIACAVVGTFVVLRGLAFIGDALAHGVLPGIAGALLIGAPGLVGATVGALAMIGGVALITHRSRLSSDTAIGLLFVGMLALGVVIVSRSSSFAGDLVAILFGQILGTSWGSIESCRPRRRWPWRPWQPSVRGRSCFSRSTPSRRTWPASPRAATTPSCSSSSP